MDNLKDEALAATMKAAVQRLVELANVVSRG
jgi:hypothetical protein